MVQSNAPAEIYQLHILLLQINPPIWRRLHVRSDSSIATLHELLQIAFDWSDFHLHRFVIRGKEYGLSRSAAPRSGPTRRKRFFPDSISALTSAFFTNMISAICGNIRSASNASSPSAKRSSTRFALVGLVHHRPKIAVGRKPTWRRWTITAGIHPWMNSN